MDDLPSIVKVLAVASAVALLQMSVAVFADEPSETDIRPPTYGVSSFDNSLPSFPTASAFEYEAESGGEADPPPIEIPELSWQDDPVYIDFPSEELEELPRWSDAWFSNDVLDSGQVLDSGSGGSIPSTPTMAEDIAAIRSYTEFVLFGLLPFCVAAVLFWLLAVWFYRTFIASAFH